jgi:hypothetical protein
MERLACAGIFTVDGENSGCVGGSGRCGFLGGLQQSAIRMPTERAGFIACNSPEQNALCTS